MPPADERAWHWPDHLLGGCRGASGSGEAFDRGRDFAAWLGLVPKQFSTGGRTVLGGITKRGNTYLRMLFVQAARVIMMRKKLWKNFSFGAWLQQADARMNRHKLAIALANKLARIAWSVLRHGRDIRCDQSAVAGDLSQDPKPEFAMS